MESDVANHILPRRRSLGYWLGWLAKRTLLLFLALVALNLLIYWFEDISGWLAWEKAKQQLSAEHFSMDPQTYSPAPVPDAENFGALPYFQLQPDPDQANYHIPLVWETTVRPFTQRIPCSKDDNWAPDLFPFLGHWNRNEEPDMDAVRRRFVELSRTASPPVAFPPNASATEMFSLLCPLTADLRKEDAARVECRFNWNREPGSIDYAETIANLIGLAKLLAYEESLAIHDKHPQLALDDLKVGWKVQAGVAKEPMLVSGLVGIGMMAIQLNVVQEGLHEHTWNDAQLTELDGDLEKFDFIANGRNALQGDFVTYTVPLVLRYTGDRSLMTSDIRKNMLQMKEIDRSLAKALKSDSAKDGAGSTKLEVDDVFTRDEELTLWFTYWWPPNGDLYRSLANCAEVMLPSAAESLDPAGHRVYPEKVRHVISSQYPIGQMLNAIPRFAASQAESDEARIACRLERYRLAHNTYPASLYELTSDYGNNLPCDVMNSEPYLYKRDGNTYLLYSVAWNQKDDGGSTGKSSNYNYSTDSPDWVWCNHLAK